jgi:very-short-patch-repair endonuclease
VRPGPLAPCSQTFDRAEQTRTGRGKGSGVPALPLLTISVCKGRGFLGLMRHQSRLVSHRREKRLRSSSTPAEKRLWSGLRSLSFKFRRQHRIGSVIVDFYCPEVRLALEVDGSVHSGETAVLHDFERDQRLRALGIRVLHFRNEHVLSNIAEVLSRIEDVCLRRSVPHSPCIPSPRGRPLHAAARPAPRGEGTDPANSFTICGLPAPPRSGVIRRENQDPPDGQTEIPART